MSAWAPPLEYSERFDEAGYGTEGGPRHDPKVIAWQLAPTRHSGRRINLAMETGAEPTLGMTVADWWGATGLPPNVNCMRQMALHGFSIC